MSRSIFSAFIVSITLLATGQGVPYPGTGPLRNHHAAVHFASTSVRVLTSAAAYDSRKRPPCVVAGWVLDRLRQSRFRLSSSPQRAVRSRALERCTIAPKPASQNNNYEDPIVVQNRRRNGRLGRSPRRPVR